MKLASTQKDMLIAELKAENYELKTWDKDYSSLYNWLVDTENWAKLISQDNLRLDHELRLWSESDTLAISKL